jgi:hypothetical protein
MEKQDITTYSDRELSLLVLNDGFFYRALVVAARTENFNYLLDKVKDHFIFTDEQEEDLRETWEDEVEEYNEELKADLNCYEEEED